jgi:hypothetical protein
VNALNVIAAAEKSILCAIHPRDAIQKILDCLGIPSRPPPISPPVLGSETEEYINQQFLRPSA